MVILVPDLDPTGQVILDPDPDPTDQVITNPDPDQDPDTKKFRIRADPDPINCMIPNDMSI